MIVPDNQLSLAIGKEGQNARLAARLTGWRIDIKSETQAEEASAEIEALLAEEESFTPPTMDWEELISAEDGEGESFLEEPVAEEEFVAAPEEAGEFVEAPLPEELEEELLEEEEFREEEPKKKKTKKRSKKRVQELFDELEEEIDHSRTTKPNRKRKKSRPRRGGIIFTEEDTSGFTIGQLLSDELKRNLH